MIAAVLIALFAAVMIGAAFLIGGAFLPVLLVIAAIAVGVWFFMLAGSRRTAGDIARRPPKQEFLGPGGPDDPDR